MTATKNAGARGRPRSFDADRAVDTAMRLFHARGYDAVGVAELSGELGIKPPSFYAAFGSKAGLFARALERYAGGEANVFAHALAEGGGVAAVLEGTLRRAAQIYPTHDGAAGCLVLDGTRNSADSEARALTAALRAASRAAIADFVAAHRRERVDEIVDFVVIALQGMSAAARDGADEATLTAFAANAGRALRREFALA